MDEDTGSEFLAEVCKERDLDNGLALQAFQNLKVLLPDTPFIGTAASIGRLSVMRSSLVTTLLRAFEIDEDGEVVVQSEGRTLTEILKYLTRKYVIDAPSLNAQRYGHRRITGQSLDSIHLPIA